MSCDHSDVRYCADERGAIACFACGRLFGTHRADGTFVAYNPPGRWANVTTIDHDDIRWEREA